MGFWNGFKRVVGVIGPVAGVVASAQWPAYRKLIEVGWQTVYQLEELFPAGNGDRKAGLWMQEMAKRTPEIVKGIEAATGKELVDEDALAAGLSQLREAQVNLMKAFRYPQKG